MRQGWLLYGNGGPFTAEDDLASLLTKSGGLDLIRVADEGHDLLCTLIPRRSY